MKKRLKRFISTFACALAVLTSTCVPVQADFYRTLQRNQPWSVVGDNTNNLSPSAITVFYLGRHGVLDLEIITIPGHEGGGGVDLRIPKGTRRIIIELDAATSTGPCPSCFDTGIVPLTVTQGFGTNFQNAGEKGARMVIDVE